MRALVRCVALAVCCAALSATAGGAELDEDAARPEEQTGERAARRGQAIRDLQAHAKQGYKPGADVMEGARDGGALGLSEYLQALLGWEDHTWATVKRVGTYGKYACYTLLVLLTLGVFNGLRNAIAFQTQRETEREAAEQARREELLAKMKGEWRPSLSAAIAGTQGSAREKHHRD